MMSNLRLVGGVLVVVMEGAARVTGEEAGESAVGEKVCCSTGATGVGG